MVRDLVEGNMSLKRWATAATTEIVRNSTCTVKYSDFEVDRNSRNLFTGCCANYHAVNCPLKKLRAEFYGETIS